MSEIRAIVIGIALLLAFWGGSRWEQGKQAIALKAAQDAAQEARDEAVEAANKKGTEHATELERLNKQLLSTTKALTAVTNGRFCLSAPAVRLLNGGANLLPSAASQPANEAGAFATDRDVGQAYAECSSRYSKLTDQLNKILDIEEQRQNQR